MYKDVLKNKEKRKRFSFVTKTEERETNEGIKFSRTLLRYDLKSFIKVQL